MIQRYTFGKPIDTESCVLHLHAEGDAVQFGTISIDRKAEEPLFRYTYLMDQGDILYGLGENVRGINKRGFKYISLCSDTCNQSEECPSLYGAHNFLIVSGKETFGIFFDYPAQIEFDCGYTQEDTLSVSAMTADIDVYTITPQNESSSPLIDIVRQFRGLTGKNYVPPFWAFGYQQSRWGYRSADDIRDVAKKYSEKHIPLDALYLDIDYMERYKDFTIDEKSFPHFEQFVGEMKARHIHLVPIIDAGVKVESGYDVCDEGEQKNFFCKKADGKDFVAGVWPGRSHFPDFLNKNAREWFGMQYKKLIDKGIDGFWNDMNEPALFYSDESLEQSFADFEKYRGKNLDIKSFFEFSGVSHSSFNNVEDYKRFYHRMTDGHGGTTTIRHDKVHNLFGYNMTRAASDAFKKICPQKRILLFSRASCIGAHRYGGIWTGDNSSRWDHLLMGIKMMPSLNMCGFLYTGTDIGGFGGNTTRDLLLRWLAFADFTPLMRNHSADGERRQECYQFDHTEDFQSVIGLRYRLIPYLYSEFMKSSLDDGMFIKPLGFVWCDDDRAARTEDELLVGESILIAPVHEQNATGRYIYLPEDMTLCRYHGNKLTEQTTLTKGDHYIDVPLADVVFFVRQNHAVPFCNKTALNTDEIDYNDMTFIGTPSKACEYKLYRDDGVTPITN